VGYCDSTNIPPSGIEFNQGPSVSPEPRVLQLIPFQDSNGWNYYFSVGGADIVAVSMPYFNGWDLSQIMTSEGWTYEITQTAASHPQELVLWTRQNGMPSSFYTVGAAFTSNFAPTLAAVEVRNAVGNIFEKQVFIPLTPSAIEAGYVAASLPVPEPSTALLLASGIVILVTSCRTRSRAKEVLNKSSPRRTPGSRCLI
jgi:hypothetical protein